VAQPQYGFVPSHKINVTYDSNTFTYWYVQEPEPEPATARAFDSQKDRDLVELMHALGWTGFVNPSRQDFR